MDAVLAPVAAIDADLLWQLREGTLTLFDALNDEALNDHHALEVLGHAMIGAEVIDPGATALIMARCAAVEHGTTIAELTNTQRVLLVYGARLQRAA